MISKTPKRGENAPFLAYLLNALWYFRKNLHFLIMALDEQVDLNIELSATFDAKPPS